MSARAKADVELTKGDRRPALRVVFLHARTLAPFSLTDPRLLMTPVLGGDAKIDYAQMSIDPEDDSIATYEWGATDTNTEGDFWMVFRDTDGSGKHVHFPAQSAKLLVRITAAE